MDDVSTSGGAPGITSKAPESREGAGRRHWPRDTCSWGIYERLSQTYLCVLGNLWRRHGSTVACRRVRGTDYNSPRSPGMLVVVLLKEVAIATITPTVVWPWAKLQGENTAPSISRKLD